MALNRRKCRFLLLKGNLRPPPGISLVPIGESEPLLGGRLSHVIDDLSAYPLIIDKMKSRIERWKRWHLSWYGRALIANSVILPLFWYYSSISATPDSYLSQVRTCIDQYVFNRSPCRISRINSVLPPSCGGIGAPHIDGYALALKARWVCLYLQNPHALWACFFRWKIDQICLKLGISQPFSANLPSAIKKFGFVGEALYAWSILPKSPNFRVCSADLADSFPIVQNPSFDIPEKLQSRLCRAGITQLQDLLSDSGAWLSTSDIHSQYSLRISGADLLSIQRAIPTRFITAAINGHTKISLGDWLELRCDSSLSPYYLKVLSKVGSLFNLKKFQLSDGGLLIPTQQATINLSASDINLQFRKVFVLSRGPISCLIGDLYQRAIILSPIDRSIDSPLLIEASFRSLRLLLLPPHRIALPRNLIHNFDYERAYRWLTCFLFDIPLRSFGLRLVHQKISILADVPCLLCSKASPSVDHILYDCDVTDAFLELFQQKCSLWFPSFSPPPWKLPVSFDSLFADSWNLASICAKAAIYSQYWACHFGKSHSASSPIAIARCWLKMLREFLLAASLKGVKLRSRWQCNGTWILADGSLNMEQLSL